MKINPEEVYCLIDFILTSPHRPLKIDIHKILHKLQKEKDKIKKKRRKKIFKWRQKGAKS